MHLHQQVGQHGADLFAWQEAACSTADTLAAGEGQVACSTAESLAAGEGQVLVPCQPKTLCFHLLMALYYIYPPVPFNATLVLGMFCLRARFVSICISSLFCPTLRCNSGDGKI
jgi:hypothetical protein